MQIQNNAKIIVLYILIFSVHRKLTALEANKSRISAVYSNPYFPNNLFSILVSLLNKRTSILKYYKLIY
jgi:hypothetical protein